MKIVKITVLETSLNKGFCEEYAVDGLEPCPILKPGQVFYATNTCPKGMCDAAWRTINQYVFALACGVREFYGGGWFSIAEDCRSGFHYGYGPDVGDFNLGLRVLLVPGQD